jgi:ribonuclease T2
VNSKKIIQLILVVLAAAFTWWQTQGSGSAPAPQRPTGNAHTQDQPHHNRSQSQPQAPSTAGEFDYYLMSLSWSPSYCITHPDDKRQCGRGYGFVLHGLWPQRTNGGYPQECASNDTPSAAVVAKTLAFMPSEKLIHHEWSKHGTCSGLSATQYFDLADRAFASVAVPAKFQQPRSDSTASADDIVTEFAKANPAIPAASFTVHCSGSELQEVRVCLSTDAKGQACGRGVRTQCRDGAVQIPASR